MNKHVVVVFDMWGQRCETRFDLVSELKPLQWIQRMVEKQWMLPVEIISMDGVVLMSFFNMSDEDIMMMVDHTDYKDMLSDTRDVVSPILVWGFRHAPEKYRNLSEHGGDEDWIAFIPSGFPDQEPLWMEEGTSFGCCDVFSYPVEGGTVRIGAHA